MEHDPDEGASAAQGREYEEEVVPELEQVDTFREEEEDPPNLYVIPADLKTMTKFVKMITIFCTAERETDQGPCYVVHKRLPQGTTCVADGKEWNRKGGKISVHTLEGVIDRMRPDPCMAANMYTHQGTSGDQYEMREEKKGRWTASGLPTSLSNFRSCLEHISRLRMSSIAFTPDTGCGEADWTAFRQLIARFAHNNPCTHVYIASTPVPQTMREQVKGAWTTTLENEGEHWDDNINIHPIPDYIRPAASLRHHIPRSGGRPGLHHEQ